MMLFGVVVTCWLTDDAGLRIVFVEFFSLASLSFAVDYWTCSRLIKMLLHVQLYYIHVDYFLRNVR